MFEYSIVAVLVLWSAFVVFKKVFPKTQVPCRLFCQIYVSDLVGTVWQHG